LLDAYSGLGGATSLDCAIKFGDVIVAVEGKPVATVSDLAAVLERVGIGNKARLTVVHSGSRREFSATVHAISPRN
jgi:S1-C subfamily serine protease